MLRSSWRKGRLREHLFWNGTYMDLLILALYRETWAEHAPPLLKRLSTRSQGQALAPEEVRNMERV